MKYLIMNIFLNFPFKKEMKLFFLGVISSLENYPKTSLGSYCKNGSIK
jgi:hypothetical protein